MYQECSSCQTVLGLGRRIQCATWSRHGPEIEVYEAIRSALAGSVTASQAWMEPQSWAITCTGRSGLTASATAIGRWPGVPADNPPQWTVFRSWPAPRVS